MNNPNKQGELTRELHANEHAKKALDKEMGLDF